MTDDYELDDWHRSGAGLRWCWPRIELVHAAHGKSRLLVISVPRTVYGAGMLIRGRGLVVRWKKP